MTTAYPLAWPEGWPRTPSLKRERAKFFSAQTRHGEGGRSWTERSDLTVAGARRRLTDELDRLGARYVTLSTNVEVTRDGTPRSDRRAPDDSGVAVYFQLGEKPMVLACDKWDRVADNIAAIAGHIDAMRKQDRYGVGSTERAFAGYEALPPPRSSAVRKPWREVLAMVGVNGIEAPDLLAIAERRYRERAKAAHTDTGGDHEAMVELNNAIGDARTELGA